MSYLTSNRSKIIFLFFVTLGISLLFQNCGSPQSISNSETSGPNSSGINGLGVICPSGTPSCSSSEELVSVENEFGCSYIVCQDRSSLAISCQESTEAFCSTGLVPASYTDRNSCQVSACVAEAAGGGIGSGGETGTSDCTSSAFVCQAYNDILGRLPDQPGALYYNGLINGAATENERTTIYTIIITEMANSLEAKGLQPLDPATVMCTGAVSCL